MTVSGWPSRDRLVMRIHDRTGLSSCGRRSTARVLPRGRRRRRRRARSAGEDVVSFFVHHEPTFDRDEVRRHLTRRRADAEPADPGPHRRARRRRPAARALHLDLHRGDPLSSVKSVVVTRMVTNPTVRARRRRPRPCSPSAGAASAGSTSSPPAAATPSATPTTATPACWPPTTSRSGSRPPPTAPTPSSGLLSFAESLSARTQARERRPSAGLRRAGLRRALARRRRAGRGRARSALPLGDAADRPDAARRAGVRRLPGRRPGRRAARAATPTRRRTSPRCSTTSRPAPPGCRRRRRPA